MIVIAWMHPYFLHDDTISLMGSYDHLIVYLHETALLGSVADAEV